MTRTATKIKPHRQRDAVKTFRLSGDLHELPMLPAVRLARAAMGELPPATVEEPPAADVFVPPQPAPPPEEM